MTPADVAHSYDAIADRWLAPERPLTGLAAHERAMRFVQQKRFALDVGCGCNRRIAEYLRSEGFAVDGVDLSARMIELARSHGLHVSLHLADIRSWTLPRAYDFISAWDSIWHVPLADQEGVLAKLCGGLTPGGVLIFSFGGLDAPGEVRDSAMGVPMYHATLGIPRTLDVLSRSGCICKHLEFDQLLESHAFVIAQRPT